MIIVAAIQVLVFISLAFIIIGSLGYALYFITVAFVLWAVCHAYATKY